MRHSITIAVLIATIQLTVQPVVDPVAHADDLFSEIAMESVFETSDLAQDTITKNSATDPVRITGLGTLTKSLEAAGYQPTRSGKFVRVQTQQAGLNLPFYLSVSIEQDELMIELPVAKVADPSKLDANKLLELLGLTDTDIKLVFAYDKSQRTIELRHRMSNRSIDPHDLKKSLTRMESMAIEHSETWSTFAAKPTDAVASVVAPKATTPPTAKTSAARLSLVGLWSANLSPDEAFAIRIESTANFQLVHLKAGKSSVSKGKATKSGNKLTLSGEEGTKIAGTFTQSANDAFTFNVAGANGKTALSLKFRKSKSATAN